MLLIELAMGVVLPDEPACHMVPVQDGYAVVKIDFVHENAEIVELDIPQPEAEIFTLGDARNTRIQWKKSVIHIPPIGRSVASSVGRPSASGQDQKRPRTPAPEPVN